MSFDFSAARFVAAGPTDLELRLADAPSNAEPIAQARIRTDQPLLTAPVIGGILLALYAVFTLEATNRTLARRKKRSIGSIIGAGILGVLLAASFGGARVGPDGPRARRSRCRHRDGARRDRRRGHRDRRRAARSTASRRTSSGPCRGASHELRHPRPACLDAQPCSWRGFGGGGVRGAEAPP